MLRQGDYEMWRLRIEQYFQITTNDAGTLTTHIPGPITNEEKAQKKNDVKARSMLLMTLPNEHLMTFNQYKDVKTLFVAIETRFGRNEATKKTQKTLLKQLYENFNATSTESFNSIFNRLQKIVSQLAVLGVFISQKDLNLEFLRRLPSEWNTHVVVWRDKSDLDIMSIDDLYNNFKIVEKEVKRTTSTNSSSQNIAFVSSPSSNNTNEVPIDFGVCTASPQVSTVNLSDAIVYAFLANQPNGSQLMHEDLEKIHKDDLKEMDLKWQLALLSMRAKRFFQKTGKKITINGSDTAGYDKDKVECFNCHKMGHFIRECRVSRNQENRTRNQETTRRTVNMEDTSSKAMVAIDGACFDWSYMADDEAPTNMAFLAFSDSEGHSHKQLEEQGYFNIGCSRHMIGNISYLTDFKEFDEGYVAFGGGAKGGKIAGKGIIRTATKDETSRILKSFITKIENLVDKKVKIIRCDNGTEFKNSVMNKFCEEKGIKREYSIARTPRQNRVSGRRNRTLTEASRTMLVDSNLPTIFWVEAVNIACYVQNRVLVVKPHFKTPYELFRGRTPALGFMKPFGCHVTILNTLDHLKNLMENKMKCSLLDTLQIVKLLEYTTLQLGSYSGTNPNDFARKGASFDVGQSSIETGPSQDYILMPLWNDSSLFDFSLKDSDVDNKDNDGLCKESEIDNQERLNAKNSTKDVNIGGQSINTASSIINIASPTVNTVRQSDDFFGADNDMRRIQEEVYVCQLLGFEDLDYPDQVYKELCIEFEELMHDKFQISSMGELTFFLGSQVKQKSNRIFISQDKYVDEILIKFKYADVKPTSTPMDKEKALLKDLDGDDVDVYLYRSMIRIFRYLKGQPKLGLWYPKDSPFDLVAYTDSEYAGSSLDRKSTSGGCQFLGYRLISWQCKKQTVVATSTTELNMWQLLVVVVKRSTTNMVKFDIGQEDDKRLYIDMDPHDFSHVYLLVTNVLVMNRAFLKKPQGSEEFHQIVDFLNASHIRTLDNGEIELNAIVDGQDKTITEASVRIHLKLADVDGISTLPTTETFEELALMGYGEGLTILVGTQYTPTVIETSPKLQNISFTYRTTRTRTRRMGIRIPQSNVPSSVADEAINKEIHDGLGRATTTASRLEAEQASGNISKTQSKETPSGPSSLRTSLEGSPGCHVTMGVVMFRLGLKGYLTCLMNYYSEKIQADEDLAQRMLEEERESLLIEERSRLLTEFIDQRKKMLAAKRAKENKNKPPTRAQQRTYMSNYIKNIGGYTLKQLKQYYFKEIKMLFDNTMESIRKFVPMKSEGQIANSKAGEGSSKEGESLKRPAEEELGQEQQKKQKVKEDLSQERLQQMMVIIPEQRIHVEALQTKEYLVKLWSLVKERFSLSNPTEDNEIALWVELKRLFEPDEDYELWKFKSFQLIWRL
nr:ribonuclease H-like domain-containing protein [Tanacetum cinerariifolium]